MWAKRFHGRAVNRKHIAMRGEPVGLFAVGLLVLRGVAVVEHLHLDTAQERHARRADWRAPHEDAGISPAAQMPPFYFHDEVLVVPQRAQRAHWFASAVNVAV